MIIAAQIEQRRYVMRCCPSAAAAGVTPGMNLTEAAALCPGALIHPWQPDDHRRAMEKLARWAGQFSPRIMIDPTPHHRNENVFSAPHGLLLDASGTDHLHANNRAQLERIRRALMELRFSPRLAAAPTIGTAWALAHYGPHSTTSLENEPVSEILAPLPVAALRLSPDTCSQLAAVNIVEIRHLMNIPRPALADRFGPEVLHRLDQALGRVHEDIEPFQQPAAFSAMQHFEAPVTALEVIFAAVEKLNRELSAQLASQWLGARELAVVFHRPHHPPNVKKISFMRPVCEPRHWWAVIRPYVERMHLGDGVQAITLTAVQTARTPPRQVSMNSVSSGPDNVGEICELLDRLINRWGGRCLWKSVPSASHIPECISRREPITRPASIGSTAPLFSWPPLDRPSILLDQPESAQCVALLPAGPPHRIEWRGTNYTVISRIGPERIVTHRTLVHQWTRDYFKLQLQDGLWLWVYHRLEDDRWFVHGIWG